MGMTKENRTKHIKDVRTGSSSAAVIANDQTAILTILNSGEKVTLRRNASTHLLKLIEEGLDIDQAAVEQIFKSEKDLAVATELKRLLNRMKARSILPADPSSRFDRRLSPAEEAMLRAEVGRLGNLYDRVRDEKGAFERRYRIEGRIAEGGMGRVFKGVQLADGRLVAVKFLLTGELSRKNNLERLVARFRREGKLLTERLKHPHIVEAYEYGEADGEYFLVMEYLNGGTLADRLKSGPVDSATFREVALQLCSVVEYLHRHGVIHRDIKPANVMFASFNGPPHIKLCDFGLSKDTRDKTLSRISFSAGTDEYSSPQQLADARSADERDDIYSLGKTFYEMLTGTIFADIGEFQKISFLNHDVPLEFTRIVVKCFSPVKEDRFQNAGALRRAITNVATQ